MADPTQQRPSSTTTTVRAAVTAAHGKPSTAPRYIVGGVLLAVGLGLFVLHVVSHHGQTDTFELRAIIGSAVAGLLILPGIAEGAAAGISGVGGALLSLKKQKDAP